jgi:hypothetical protein
MIRWLVVLASILLILISVHDANANQGDPIASVQGLIGRLLGSSFVSQFDYQVISATSSGHDVFEYETRNSKLVLRGNTGVAMVCIILYLYVRVIALITNHNYLNV